MKISWKNNSSSLFSSLDEAFLLSGELIGKDKISDIIKFQYFYIKRYYSGSRNLTRWLGRSRIEREWKNLQLIQSWGIKVPDIVAYGKETQWGVLKRGALITEEVKQAIPGHLFLQQENIPKERLRKITLTLAKQVRTMHEKGFIYNDLKPRNLLINREDEIFFIDCPCGQFWQAPFLKFRIIKDLAILDYYSDKFLSKTQRLRFYLNYSGKNKLSDEDKNRIRRIIARNIKRRKIRMSSSSTMSIPSETNVIQSASEGSHEK